MQELLKSVVGTQCLDGATEVWELGGTAMLTVAPSPDWPRVRRVLLGRPETEVGHRGEPITSLVLGGTTVEVY